MKFGNVILHSNQRLTTIIQIKCFFLFIFLSYFIFFLQNFICKVYYYDCFRARISTGIIRILTHCPLNFIHNKLFSFLLLFYYNKSAWSWHSSRSFIANLRFMHVYHVPYFLKIYPHAAKCCTNWFICTNLTEMKAHDYVVFNNREP